MAENHIGAKFDEFVRQEGLTGAKKVIKLVFEYLRNLHQIEGVHGGVMSKRIWYDAASNRVSMGNWSFYTNDRFLKY